MGYASQELSMSPVAGHGDAAAEALQAGVVAELEGRCRTFYRVQDWMIGDLGLSGACLSVFAAVWGICKDKPGGWLNGGHKALMGLCGVSRSTAKRSLASLESMGLVEVASWYDFDGRDRIAVRPDYEGVAAAAAGGGAGSEGHCYVTTQLRTGVQNEPGVGSKMNPYTYAEGQIDKHCLQPAREGEVFNNLEELDREHEQAEGMACAPKSPDAGGRHLDRPRVGAKPAGGHAAFERPSRDQVRAYVASRCLEVDADDVFERMSERGWCDGDGLPIRHWPSYLDGWPPLERAKEEARRESRRRRDARREARGTRAAGPGEVSVEEAARRLEAVGVDWTQTGYADPREMLDSTGQPLEMCLIEMWDPANATVLYEGGVAR